MSDNEVMQVPDDGSVYEDEDEGEDESSVDEKDGQDEDVST